MTEKYHPALRILHWLMALILLGMIALGWYMSGLPKGAPGRMELYNLHKSFGVTVLFLLLLRMAVRLSTFIPPLPPGFAAWERAGSQMAYAAFYIFMCLMPLSGYYMSNAFGMDVKWFGVALPHLFRPDKDWGGLARQAHGIMAYTLLGLIVLHVSAVIKHRYFDKNDVLPRMW